MTHLTKQRLIDAGLRMLLEQGYNSLGIQAVLDTTHTPKGSFYHHFKDKEDFALNVIDAYVADVHSGLDECVQDRSRAPLDRVRHFFELTQQSYEKDGYMGCLMGGLGQELSGVSEVFRAKIEWCFSSIAERLALCLAEAEQQGDIPASCDIRQMANLLVDCWEGAALRSRLRRNPAPLTTMLDFLPTFGGNSEHGWPRRHRGPLTAAEVNVAGSGEGLVFEGQKFLGSDRMDQDTTSLRCERPLSPPNVERSVRILSAHVGFVPLLGRSEAEWSLPEPAVRSLGPLNSRDRWKSESTVLVDTTSTLPLNDLGCYEVGELNSTHIEFAEVA